MRSKAPFHSSHTASVGAKLGSAGWLLVASCGALAQTANLPPPPVSPAPVAQFEYDAEGNPTKTVLAPSAASGPGNNLSSVQTYDSLGRRTTHKDARNGLTQFTYDGQDRLTQVQDPRKLLTQYERNGLGDVQKLSSPDTGASPATFDAAGQVKTRTDARGFVSSYEYDALGRLKSLQIKSPLDSSLRSFAWTYDLKDAPHGFGIGRLGRAQSPEVSADYRYDALGRILESRSVFQADSAALAVNYGYDPAGRITSIRYPSGRVVSFSYEQGQITGIQLQADAGSAGQDLLSQIQQSPFGPLQSWHWHQAGNNSTRLHERLFDLYGRPLRYPLGPWVRDLSYDAADRISAYTHYEASSAAPAVALDQRFGYDELGRLNSASLGPQAWGYAYDANGNRSMASNSGAKRSYTIASTSNRLNSISNPARAFSYDASGNILSDGNGGSGYTAVYNHEGRLARLTAGSLTMVLAYDAQGQRFRKQIGGNLAVYFAYDLQGQLMGEYTLIGNSFKPLMEYIWLEGQPVAAVRPTPGAAANAPNSAQEVFYLHTDHLGTPRVALDTAGRVRWRWMGGEPFGLSPAETNPGGLGELNISLRLPGQQYDGFVGLHYNYFRDYDPTVGRYVQSDPIGLEGGINTYAYVGSQPTAYTDPKGLSPYANPFGPLIPPDPFSSATAPNACPPEDCPNPVTVTFTTGNVCASGDSSCIQAMRAAGLQGPYTPQTHTATYSGECLLKFGVGFAGGKFAVGTVLINKAPNIATSVGLGAANVARVTKVAAGMNSPPAIAVSVSVAVFGVLKECECGKK